MSDLDKPIQPIHFVKLLIDQKQILIPMIQRDYAQGRDSQSEIREVFLNVLYDALTAESGSNSYPINLDFVYGRVSKNGNAYFVPLDGQQRLTTLYLLHWYLAWKDNSMERFQSYSVDSETFRSKFTYQTRQSSKDFFDSLAKFMPSSSVDETESIKKKIIDEPWYFRSWRLDTTIQASLTMLDAIHNRFRNVKQNLFCRLIDEKEPRITFLFLPLDEFGLNDDLYIKMNARGVPLTAFETFKARFGKYLNSEFSGERRNLDGRSVSVAEYFARRMDIRWADFFWKHRDRNTNLYDSAAINFFRAASIVSRDPTDARKYEKDLEAFRNKYLSSTYANFQRHGWLDRNLTEVIFLLLSIWSRDADSGFSRQLPDQQYFDELELFKKIAEDPTKLTYVEIVQLTAYVLYLQKNSKNLGKTEFRHWMRVVFNLSINKEYNDSDDVRTSVSGLKKIVSKIGPDYGETLKYFVDKNNKISGFPGEQIKEEKVKAELLLRNNSWTELIYEAEHHGYFQGQIKFLLDFSGVSRDVHNINNGEQGEELENQLQKQFQRYLQIAKTMFNESGLIDVGEFRWERALLTEGDYLLPYRSNHSFLRNVRRERMPRWKRLLRMGETEQGVFLRKLWDRLEENVDVRHQLDEIINICEDIEYWRLELVRFPEAIGYCKKRLIRKDKDNDAVYLLSSKQMNGWHCELFTYCLYKRLKKSEFDGNWKMEYVYQAGIAEKPYIKFIWHYLERSITFRLENDGQNFIIYIPIPFIEFFDNHPLRKLENVCPELVEFLKNAAGFELDHFHFRKKINRTDATPDLKKLICEIDSFFSHLK